MEKLNKLFSLKKILSDRNDDLKSQDKLPDEVQVRMTYFQTGFGASQQAEGKPLIFKACLENVYMSFEDQCRKLKAAKIEIPLCRRQAQARE